MYTLSSAPRRPSFLSSPSIFYTSIILTITTVLLIVSNISNTAEYDSTTDKASKTPQESIKLPTIQPSVQRQKPRKEIVKKPPKESHDAYDFVSKGYLNFYNAVLQQELFSTIYLDLLKGESLSPRQQKTLQKICSLLIGSSVRRLDVATGYACLLQLHEMNADSNSELNIFKAIKYASFSIEIFYTPEITTKLMRMIITGYENEMKFSGEKAQDINDYCTGYRTEEKTFLDNVLKLNIPTLNRRVMVRQSFISTFGRCSSNENTRQYDLEAVIDGINYVRSSMQIEQNNVFDIILSFDENSAFAGATSIVSALMNSDLDSLYKFHVVMDPASPLSGDTQRKLSSFNHIRNYAIEFILFPTELIGEFFKVKLGGGMYPLMTVYRLYLDKLFPDLDYALYLDADTVVLTDLNALKTVDMPHYVWAAVPDVEYREHRPECNGVLPNFYINDGILLTNLTNMRRAQIIEKMEDYVTFVDECDYDKPEQDFINSVLPDHIYHLPIRWNAIIFPETERYRFNSFIVHFAGNKPWGKRYQDERKNDSSMSPSHVQEWWRYRKVVGW